MLYTIGELEFKTQDKCTNFVRRTIKDLGCCTVDKNHEKFPFFMDLIENNSYYKNAVKRYVDKFCIAHNKLNKSAYHIRVIKQDKTDMSISWRQCCGVKEKPYNLKLALAMREAISSFIIKFKRKHNPLICNYCSSDACGEYHVDHEEPPFRILKDNFINISKLDTPKSFKYDEISHTYVFDEEHLDFKNNWIDYHNTNCKLQILCRTCNLRKH